MSVRQRIILILLVSSLLALPVRAADTSSGSVTVTFVPGVPFRIYQVATLSDGIYSPTPAFSGFSLPYGNASAGVWRELAIELSNHVKTNNLPPVQMATVGRDGQAVFRDLPAGIYLLTAESFFFNGQLCAPAACIIQVPPVGSLTVYPKYSALPEEGPDTGDAAMPELWAAFMLISGLGILILVNKKPRFQPHSYPD